MSDKSKCLWVSYIDCCPFVFSCTI